MRTREHFYEDNGHSHVIIIPQMWKICDECHGEGSHSQFIDTTNNVESNEWDSWDLDQRQNYLCSRHVQKCSKCNASGKLLVDDLNSLSKEHKNVILGSV